MSDKLHTVLGLFLFFFELFFILKGFQNETEGEENKQSLQTKKNKAVYYMIVGPWRTKYFWGGIIQLFLVVSIIILQVI